MNTGIDPGPASGDLQVSSVVALAIATVAVDSFLSLNPPGWFEPEFELKSLNTKRYVPVPEVWAGRGSAALRQRNKIGIDAGSG